MANEKIINGRLQQKHDIEANWLKAINFIPKAGEIIVYDKDENNNRIRLKVGDGVTKVHELDFVGGEGGGDGTVVQFVVWGDDN